MPVLESALDRSLGLAASMDARGYGRRGEVDAGRRRLTQVSLLLGLLAVLVGTYGVLDAGGGPVVLGVPALGAGAVLLVASLALGGGRSDRSRYRPDPWSWPEWLTVACGLAALGGLLLARHDTALDPSPYLGVPGVPVVAAVGILLGALPAVATPEPVS